MYEDIKQIYPEKSLHRAEDLTGQTFGKWTVLYRTENQGVKTMWVCQCSCDKHTIKPVSTKNLKSRTSESCGCNRGAKCNDTKDKKIRVRDDSGNITHKKCPKCQRMLPICNFYKNKSSYDGYSGICHQCYNESKEGRYNIYKKNAKKRNINFDISKEKFFDITSQPCVYCGEYSKPDINGNLYTGIDRIDSNKGYEIVDNLEENKKYKAEMIDMGDNTIGLSIRIEQK